MNILKALKLGRAHTLEQVSSFLLAVHLEKKSKRLYMIICLVWMQINIKAVENTQMLLSEVRFSY